MVLVYTEALVTHTIMSPQTTKIGYYEIKNFHSLLIVLYDSTRLNIFTRKKKYAKIFVTCIKQTLIKKGIILIE